VNLKSKTNPGRHVIDSIDYGSCGKAYDEAPTVCTCGWSGRAGDFAAHRAEAGLKPKGTYWLKRAPEPGAYQPQFMQALPEAKE
jgi:hypothetical protein